jgi:hypothetical protein
LTGRWRSRRGGHADPAELIVSELVTNSVQPSTDKNGRPRYDEDGLPVVHLRLACDQICVLIEVWDSTPSSPLPAGPGLTRSTDAASR